ncbi:MAG: family N-acetyltransferase [Haloplasmataceae bacterium]|nr:family N-acetyltransferase [Haloplasmataceae bacterium]
MLKKVNSETLNIMFDYVKKEPSINLFIIGDVEQFGIDVDFQEVFLQYDDNNITACVLRYYQNVIIYSHVNHFNVSEIIDLLNTFHFERINGKKAVIDKILPHLNNIKEVTQCYFCELNDALHLKKTILDISVATIDDLPKILELLKLVNFHSSDFLESNTRKLTNKAGRIYFLINNDMVISSASTSIETSVSAMIGGVTTHFNHRNLGKASQVVSKLCFDLLKESKKPCLFYHNPKAGSIYHQLGFVDIDKWTMIEMT